MSGLAKAGLDRRFVDTSAKHWLVWTGGGGRWWGMWANW